MRGLLVFNDNHELLYLKCEKSLRSLLKKRQNELPINNVEESSTAALLPNKATKAFDGFDPITIAYIFLPMIVCYESMKCMKFDRYVSIRNGNVCFYFSESNDDNRLIILAIGDGKAKKEEMTFLLSNFISALEFAFGPLCCSMAHPSLSAQLDLLTFALKNFPDSVDPDGFLSLESISDDKSFLQTILQHVDISGLASNQTELGQKSSIESALGCIGGQFHAFLKCRLCFLVRNGAILATFTRHMLADTADNINARKSADKRKSEDGVDGHKQYVLAKAWQVVTLLRTATKFGYNSQSGKRQPDPVCYYCYTISLHHHGPSSKKNGPVCYIEDVFSDVFRINLSDDTHLICITPVTHGDLMSDLTETTTMVEKLDRLRFDLALLASNPLTASKAIKVQSYFDYWSNRLNAHARSLCDRLDDRLIFMDGAKSRKHALTFQNLYRNLREISATKNRRPDVTRVGHYEGEETSTLKALRRLAGALLLDTFSAAVDEAKRYKLEKLDRCWRNLVSSDVYGTTIVNLVESFRSQPLIQEGPPADRFKLDATAYIFLLPDKRILITSGLQLGTFHTKEIAVILKNLNEIIDSLKSNRRGVTLKVISPVDKSTGKTLGEKPDKIRNEKNHLLIFLSRGKEDNNTQPTGSLFSRLGLTLSASSDSGKGRKLDDGESALNHFIKEPVIIVAAYEQFVHEDLAWRETRLLAVHLYELLVGLKWSYC